MEPSLESPHVRHDIRKTPWSPYPRHITSPPVTVDLHASAGTVPVNGSDFCHLERPGGWYLHARCV